jgi:hypothetical protein
VSVLKIEGQIFFLRIFWSVRVSVLKIEGQIFFSEYFQVADCPSVPSQKRGSDFFLRINILECPSVQVSVLKIEGQIFFLRIFLSFLVPLVER